MNEDEESGSLAGHFMHNNHNSMPAHLSEAADEFPQCGGDCLKSKQEKGILNQKKVVEDDEEELKVPSCETLRMCILTTLNWGLFVFLFSLYLVFTGLRNGGGIGDVLRSVSPNASFIQQI